MSLDAKSAAALALHRFGLGPRAGSIAAIASDPRGALLAELDRPDIGHIADTDLDAERAVLARGVQVPRRAAGAPDRRAARGRAPARDDGIEPDKAMPADAAEMPAEPDPEPNVQQQIFLARGQGALRRRASAAEIGFVERLVWFWSNHFCVSADKVPSMAGGYEREAIRPHVLGRFADMLLAAESHPAMLFYLDNSRLDRAEFGRRHQSQHGASTRISRAKSSSCIRSACAAATRRTTSRSFANVLTGWTIMPIGGNPEHGGEFVFNPRMHEPGPQTVIGKSYPDTGVEQGRAVLADLARHPATARACRAQARAPFRRRRAAAGAGRRGWRRRSATPTATSRKWPRR